MLIQVAMCPKQHFYLSIHFNSSLGNLVPLSKENPDDPTDTFDTVVDQFPNPEIYVTSYDW